MGAPAAEPRRTRAVAPIADRLGLGRPVVKALRKVFPNHFSFLWGEVALYSFVVLIVTGIYLTFFFEGSQEAVVYDGSYPPLHDQEMSAAYESVLRISFDVKGGLLIRQVHHWAALVFVGSIALHMARVYFTGAHRRPREPNWVVGCVLLLLALAGGFTGYSLPDDLLSGAGLRITNAIILSIPFVGERMAYLVFGGEWPGTDIIGRLYPVHILVIPGLIAAVVGIHLALLVRQRHTQFRGPGRTEHNVVGERVWPGFAMKSTGLLFLTGGVLTALGAMVEVNPVWLYGPYDTAAATSYAQPDWYIGFLEGTLRLFPPWETRIGWFVVNNIFYAGVVVPGLMFAVLFVAPWIERRLTGDDRDHHLLDRPRDAPGRTASGVAALWFVTILFVGGAQDVVAGSFDIAVGRVTTILQLAIVIGTPLSWFVTRRICRTLGDRPAPERTERSIVVARTGTGGYGSVPEHETPTDHSREEVPS
jgi:ubiquinol-cytochrome c reductase cytochrome b subunit